MRNAIRHHLAGTWPPADTAGTVTLPFADRHRRRLVMTDDAGSDFLLDLPEATLLGDGDGLELREGGFILVRAAEEPVIDIETGDSRTLARIAWHIGNRHTPIEVLSSGGLRILQDHVLAAMVVGLGGRITPGLAPFQAEAGAYAASGSREDIPVHPPGGPHHHHPHQDHHGLHDHG
ncbi:MAG: urease accessory protein UreE [Telmatospirillum sp.]|nr:urease accessory protein UreE [Telmatospirillum sp.]